ncbi:MAG: hypothetical protein AAFZ15_15890 [Bacteroidota bacterium]
MFQKQVEVIQQLANYLNSKKEKGIAAFKALNDELNEKPAAHVVMMMAHEHLEVYIKRGDSFDLYQGFFEVISHGELSEGMSYDNYPYDENIPAEDYVYWSTYDFEAYLFEMWLVQCFHASGIKEQIKIPIYYMSVPESEEVFYLNEFKKKYIKEAFKEFFEMTMKHNSIESPLK